VSDQKSNLVGYDVNNTIKCYHETGSRNKAQMHEQEGNDE
jgi:hypothetical protein